LLEAGGACELWIAGCASLPKPNWPQFINGPQEGSLA